MKQLFPSDYVLYDRANDHVLQFSNGDIIIFGNKDEAEEDCRGNEEVISCDDLPVHWKEVLISQINND